ncbi:MAG: carboxypeptidase regulatory-like domain-containing protein [bacterium]
MFKFKTNPPQRGKKSGKFINPTRFKRFVNTFTSWVLFFTVTIWSIGAPMTAFVPTAKAVSSTIVISELQVNGEGTAGNEFVEIYNKTDSAIDLAGWDIAYEAPTATGGTHSWTPVAEIDAGNHLTIPAYGFFLVASNGYNPFGIYADINGTSALGLASTGGYVALRNASDAVVDFVGYGTLTTETLCEEEELGACAPNPGNFSIERKAIVSSSALTMGFGGTDEWSGNGYDTDDNSANFVLKTFSDPQKSTFPSESSNFMITNVMPMGPQMVSLMFNKQIDASTVSNSVATLSTADTSDNSAITSITVRNGNELEIYASGANINGMTGSDTITISNVVKDIGGNVNTSTTEKAIQFFMPPEVQGAQFVDANTIKINFSKAMDEASAEAAAAYTIYIDGEAVGMTGATYTLNTGGTSKELTIVLASAFNASDGNDYVKPLYDSPSSPRDTQGNDLMATFGWQREFYLDGTKPYIVSGRSDDTTVTLNFSEELASGPSSPAETATNYVFGGATGACAGTKSVRFQEATDGPMSMDTIVITCSGGVTLNTDDTVTVSTNVTDKAGLAMDTTSSKNIFTVSATSNTAIKISTVTGNPANGSYNMQMDGCMDAWGMTGNYQGADAPNDCDLNEDTGNRDSLVVKFNGSIDPNSINYNTSSNIAYNVGSFLEIYEKHSRSAGSSAECQPWETWNGSNACVEKMMGNFGNAFGVLSQTTVANDTLTIYLQGMDVNIFPGMEIKPTGIRGLNGLTALQNDTAENNQFTMTFAEVNKVVVTDDDTPVGTYDGGDKITLFFSTGMDTSTITNVTTLNNVLKPNQHMPYWAQHTFGVTNAAVAWGDISGTACDTGGTPATNNCLEITLGDENTVRDKDDIMIEGTLVSSATGMPIGWGGMIDSTLPKVQQVSWNATSRVLILEYTKMLKDLGTNTIANATLETISETTGGPGDMFTKIKITFAEGHVPDPDATVDFTTSNITDENGNIIPNLTRKATNSFANNQIALSADDVAPILRKLRTNDWNGDGALNGGDEILLIFDNEVTDTDSRNTSDIDYSGTVTSNSIKTDLVVKRGSSDEAGATCANGTVVTNAFGDWINYWIDMWEEHAGELHLNLGMGANIQAGDRICSAASPTMADYAGNTLAGDKVLAVVQESRDAQIAKVVYTDANTAGLTNGDTFVVHFSSEINPATLGSYTSGGNPAVTNLQWGLGVEFNWEAGNMNSYDPSTIKTWGDATANWNAGFTQLTITLVCGATPCNASTNPGDASLADFDMIKAYSVQTADGAWINKPGFIDLSAPTLTHVLGDKAGETYASGDTLTFLFSEPMDDDTITEATIATLQTELGISDSKTFGTATAEWEDPEKKALKVTLGEGTTVLDATTFDPAASVKDKNGNADATASAVSITTQSVKPATSVVLADTDTTYPGIDGRDVKITWTAPTGYDATYTYDLYVLPDFVPFNPDANGTYASGETTHFPIATADQAASCTAAVCSYTAGSYLMTDSRSAINKLTGATQANAPFFPLSDWEKYTAYVVAIDGSANRAFPQKYSSSLYLTMEYGGTMDNKSPWIEGTMPFDGAIVPINNKKLNVKFSEPMARASVETSGNIKIQQCSADCHLEVSWTTIAQTVSVSYNDDNNEAKIDVATNLTANTKYRIFVSGTAVTDKSSLTLGNNFTARFRTSATSDSTAPKVIGNSFQFENVGTVGANGAITGVPRTKPMVGIAFDKDMDPSSFTSTSVSLTPSVSNSNFFYDPMMKGLSYFFGGPLAKNTTYTLTLSGVYVKDVAGNTLDGDQSGTASGDTSDNSTLTFTSENTDLNTTQPTITWIMSDGHHVDVGFSADMNKSAVTNKANWSLAQGSNMANLQISNFDYDPFMRELHIGPIEITAGSAYTLTPSSSVLGMNGATIDISGSQLIFTPESWDATFTGGTFGTDMYQEGGMFGTGGMFGDTNMTGFDNMMMDMALGGGEHMGAFDPMMAGKMYMDNAYMDNDIKTFMPIDAWPMNQVEGKTTNYHIGFPTSKAIPHGGKVVLQFPSGFEVANAAMATDEFMTGTPLFFFNRDINGPGGTTNENSQFSPAGRVQVSAITANNMDKTVTLTLAVEDIAGCTLAADGNFSADCTNTSVAGTNATMPFDYIDFELSGIKNGSASEIDWQSDTGGYQISITTKNNQNKVLEGGTSNPIKSMKFPIKAAGAGSISGKVTGPSGITAIADAMVFIDSPMSGPINIKTGADGTYSATGLPVAAGSNTYEGWYHIRVESPKNNDSYFGGSGFDVQLTQSSPTVSSKNVRLQTAANTLTVKLTTGGIVDDVMVWVGGPNGHNEKKFTLDLIDDDDPGTPGIQNHLEIKVADGEWDVGVHPFFPEAMFMTGPPPPPSFMPPVPKTITVSGNTNVSISLTSAAYEITGIVKNADTAKGLSNVNVHAFSAFGGQMPSDTQTRSDGSFTLKVSPGIYKIETFMPGLPPAPPQTVEVTDASVSRVEINMYKPAKTISGKVTDGTNGIRDAGVNAWNSKGQFIFKNTDTNGEYVLYVDADDSWSVEVFAPGFGRLSPATGVTATDIDTTSSDVTGINFTISNSNIIAISGMVKDANNNGVAGVQVWADQVSYVGGTEGAMTGVGNCATTDANGSYSINVAASTAGVGATATRYKIGGRDPNSGDLTPITGIDASASVTGKNLTISTSRTITIDIQNAPSNSLLDPADTSGYYMDKGMLDIYSPTANKGNNKKITDTDLSDESDGTISVPEGSGYRAHLHIPGYGEFVATENGTTGFAVSGGNKTIHFDLKRQGTAIAPITISGVVTDASSNASPNAYVSAINEDTYEVIGKMTDSSGAYSLKIPDLNPDGTEASYKIRVDKPNYSSPTAESAVTVNKSDANFQLTSNSSAISGTVCENSDCSIVVKSAEVMAQEVNGEGFKRTTSNADTGTFSLSLAPNKVWNITAKSKAGDMGQKLNISSGTTELQVVLTNQINAATQGIISSIVKNQQIKPSDGGIVNDLDNTGVKLTIPKDALGDSESYVPINIQEIASVPETSDFKPLGGIGKEITSTVSVENDINLEFAFDKTETEAMTETTATHNALAQLDQVQNVYWDDNANNYVPLSTTKTVEVKTSPTDETWTPVAWDTFIDNVDDSDGNGDYDYYEDYKITLKSSTNHFTIFGLKTGSDSTAPSTPSGLSATSGNSSISLAWTANTDVDLMEYEVYRKTTAGVTVSNANQVNTSQVATNSYTDTTVSNWTSYYYIITATDSSQNESLGSSEVQVCPNPGVSNGTVSVSCVITCSSGYTVNNSAHTCTAPSNGGGGIIINNQQQTSTAETTAETTEETTEVKPAAIEQPVETISTAAKEFAEKIVAIVADAVELVKANVNSLLAKLGVKRELAKEVHGVGKYVNNLIKDATVTKNQQYALTNFVTYGTNTTLSLGEGERAGVVNSYKSAFRKLPNIESEWSDAIKIANGRWPSETSETAESNAIVSFKKIYLREPDRINAHDDAAVVVMAYGLRPANRLLENEKAAIKIFENIYKYSPVNATDWDAVRAIAYSGATR